MSPHGTLSEAAVAGVRPRTDLPPVEPPAPAPLVYTLDGLLLDAWYVDLLRREAERPYGRGRRAQTLLDRVRPL